MTVVKTYGSSPRPPGALLAIREDGSIVGSVSGGCVEDDLIEKVRASQLSKTAVEIRVYGATDAEAARFKLPCGGTLELLIEPVQSTRWVEGVLDHMTRQQLVRRTVNLSTAQVTYAAASASDAEISLSKHQFSMVYGPSWRLLIIGAAQTSIYLAEMAKVLDYQVYVCDPREEMLATWLVKGVTLLSVMPDDAVLQLEPDARTAIVALTHDPKLDDMALLEALKSAAFYVGALGSQSNNAKRRDRLAMFDLSVAEIQRLHGPIGLPIGSKTPAEIAVSILAELIQLRRQKTQMLQAHDQHSATRCSA